MGEIMLILRNLWGVIFSTSQNPIHIECITSKQLPAMSIRDAILVGFDRSFVGSNYQKAAEIQVIRVELCYDTRLNCAQQFIWK